MAISSPLLEDIDLAGARGILVNITAGLDMAIGEFEEVGNVVRSFAADDATVVVGTAIDEALEGELRVTVVATGLNPPERQQLRSVQTGIRSRSNVEPRVASGGYGGGSGGGGYGQRGGTGGGAGAGGGTGGAPGYDAGYEKPSVVRRPGRDAGGARDGGHDGGRGGHGGGQGGYPERQGGGFGGGRGSRQPAPERGAGGGQRDPQDEVEYLDIPAFLRRQAD